MTDSASQSLVDRNWEMFLRDIEPFSKKLIGSIRIDMDDVRSIQAAAARITELEAERDRLAGELDTSNNNHRAMAHQLAELGARCLHAESGLSRVEGETIERCANFLAREYPDNANTNAFCAAIRSVPPLAKRGDQEKQQIAKSRAAEDSETKSAGVSEIYTGAAVGNEFPNNETD